MTNTFMHFGSSDDEYRREELIRKIEHSVERLTTGDLEALYYDMLTKDYIRECIVLNKLTLH